MNFDPTIHRFASLDLSRRTGLPVDLLFLAREFPRTRWTSLKPTTTAQAWLGMHNGFRSLQRYMKGLGTEWREGRLQSPQFRLQMLGVLNQYLEGMHVHHFVESSAYFPKLRAMEPRLASGFELMEKDHKIIDRVIHELTNAGDVLDASNVESESFKRAAERLIDTAMRSAPLIDRHLLDEEELVIPLLTLRSHRFDS
jgi:hypothetical protein